MYVVETVFKTVKRFVEYVLVIAYVVWLQCGECFHLLYAGGCVPFAVLKLSDGKVKMKAYTITVHECAALNKQCWRLADRFGV